MQQKQSFQSSFTPNQNSFQVSSGFGMMNFGSNQDQLAMLQQGNSFEVRLKQAFQAIVEGRMLDSKAAASAIANEARVRGDHQSAMIAGQIWTAADGLQKAQEALSQENFSQAKTFASSAANASRSLMMHGVLDPAVVDQIVTASGGYWTAADKSEKKGNGANTPMVDQHRFNHENGGVFCGIATMLMVLKANGKNPPAETRAQIQKLAQGIYYSGSGTDGAGMAGRLRDNGLSNATFNSTGGISQIVATLDKGQPVPLGVMHTSGKVIELPSNGSKRYPHLRVGSNHYAEFHGSGHWLLVTAYEGDKKNPSSFIVNDPDVGGKLRIDRKTLERMALGNGNMYMVTQ